MSDPSFRDVVKQQMAELEKSLCESDPSFAIVLGKIEKERLEKVRRQKQREKFYKGISADLLAREVERFDPLTELAIEGLRELGVFYRYLPEGGSMEDPDMLEVTVRSAISHALLIARLMANEKGDPEEPPPDLSKP